MNWKAIVPIALSLIIASAGSLMLYKWINTQTATKEVVTVEAEAVPIAVAAIDLTWGTKLTKEMIKTSPFLKESLPPGYFDRSRTVEGRVLISPLKAGDPILAHRLAPEDVKTGGVSAILGKGKRAIAVKGDKVIGISGFINPGNRVDVLVTMTDPSNNLEKTKVVLENVPVLATGTQIEENEKGEPAPVDVYTLEVTPADGEKLALAATQGRLQFALRNLTDGEKVLTPGATITKTLASLTAPPAKKPSEKKIYPPARSVTVEIIRGNDVKRHRIKY